MSIPTAPVTTTVTLGSTKVFRERCVKRIVAPMEPPKFFTSSFGEIPYLSVWSDINGTLPAHNAANCTYEKIGEQDVYVQWGRAEGDVSAGDALRERATGYKMIELLGLWCHKEEFPLSMILQEGIICASAMLLASSTTEAAYEHGFRKVVPFIYQVAAHLYHGKGLGWQGYKQEWLYADTFKSAATQVEWRWSTCAWRQFNPKTMGATRPSTWIADSDAGALQMAEVEIHLYAIYRTYFHAMNAVKVGTIQTADAFTDAAWNTAAVMPAYTKNGGAVLKLSQLLRSDTAFLTFGAKSFYKTVVDPNPANERFAFYGDNTAPRFLNSFRPVKQIAALTEFQFA